MLELFSHSETWIALLTLTFLEIILGIDNIIFISITAGKLPEQSRKKVTRIGLLLAMVFRIILLLGVSYLIAMDKPFYSFNLSWFSADITGQSLILLGGGLFLLYKSTREIHHKVEGVSETVSHVKAIASSFSKVLVQIVLIDIIFSFDSVLTAVVMTNVI